MVVVVVVVVGCRSSCYLSCCHLLFGSLDQQRRQFGYLLVRGIFSFLGTTPPSRWLLLLLLLFVSAVFCLFVAQNGFVSFLGCLFVGWFPRLFFQFESLEQNVSCSFGLWVWI